MFAVIERSNALHRKARHSLYRRAGVIAYFVFVAIICMMGAAEGSVILTVLAIIMLTVAIFATIKLIGPLRKYNREKHRLLNDE